MIKISKTQNYADNLHKIKANAVRQLELVEYLKPGEYTKKSGIIPYIQKENDSISICKIVNISSSVKSVRYFFNTKFALSI